QRASRPCAKVSRGSCPHRMLQAGELALHPHELASVVEGLFLVVLHVAADQISALFGAAFISGLLCRFIIVLPDFLAVLDRSVERNVWITMLRRPHDCLAARNTRNP